MCSMTGRSRSMDDYMPRTPTWPCQPRPSCVLKQWHELRLSALIRKRLDSAYVRRGSVENGQVRELYSAGPLAVILP